jgi:tRNA(Ile)-lysidine synthase
MKSNRAGSCRAEKKFLVAVSGGLDSMTLLHALQALGKKKRRWKISVAHFNHQLRGRSSDADEKLVRKIAAAENCRWPSHART